MRPPFIPPTGGSLQFLDTAVDVVAGDARDRDEAAGVVGAVAHGPVVVDFEAGLLQIRVLQAEEPQAVGGVEDFRADPIFLHDPGPVRRVLCAGLVTLPWAEDRRPLLQPARHAFRPEIDGFDDVRVRGDKHFLLPPEALILTY